MNREEGEDVFHWLLNNDMSHMGVIDYMCCAVCILALPALFAVAFDHGYHRYDQEGDQ